MTQRMYLSPPHMSGREFDLVGQTFADNWIAPAGPMIDRLEADLCALTKVGHAVALSSGTAALHLALRLAGVGAGDDVWGTTMTFIGGVSAIDYVGANPVFLDIDANSMLLDFELLENALSERAVSGRLPKAVISTDLYGNVVDQAKMRALADRFDFVWISDTAEAVGAYRDGHHAGFGADFVILSFNGNKIITTSGGGALLSDDAEAISRARFLSTQARDPAPHYEHTTIGYNYRMSNVCAAIGVGQLEVLSDRVAARRAVHDRYRVNLGGIDGIAFSDESDGDHWNRWLTTIMIDPARTGFDRERLRLALEEENIESRPLWKPMHLQPVFAHAEAIGGAVAAKCFEDGLCLPSGSAMAEGDIDRVCEHVRRLVG